MTYMLTSAMPDPHVLRTWTPEMVNNDPDPTRAFAEYCQQTLGVPWPTKKDMIILRKKCKDFFALYPHTDWRTLCRVVVFLRARKRRPSRVWMVVDEFRKAWAAGQIPELNENRGTNEHVEANIAHALETETDPVWRRRLMLAQGPIARREVYREWLTSCSSR